RHLEIGESIDRLARSLAGSIPADIILVRHVDPARGQVETLAAGFCGPDLVPLPSRSDCSSPGMHRVGAWCRQGNVLHVPGGTLPDRAGEARLRGGVQGEGRAGPLNAGPGLLGVVFCVSRTRAFGPEHVELAGALLEPLNVALENDHRVRELNALREALEAEK